MAVRRLDRGLRVCAAAFEVVGAEGAGRECGGRVTVIRSVLSHALADHPGVLAFVLSIEDTLWPTIQMCWHSCGSLKSRFGRPSGSIGFRAVY